MVDLFWRRRPAALLELSVAPVAHRRSCLVALLQLPPCFFATRLAT
jgi:hypothetical protein